MSGFQAIGLVLGVFPLATAALENHRQIATRLKLFNEIKLEYRKCSNDLAFQELIFMGHLKRLLLPLFVDNEKVKELIAKPAGEAWKDVSMVELLQQRLGDSYELYQEYIKATVARNKPPSGKDQLSFQLFRLKFSKGSSVRTNLFAELQAYNDKLEKLLHSSDELFALEQRRASRDQNSAICSFWIQAKKLFKALAAAWKCHCRDHFTRLLLQHRATKSTDFELLFIKSLPSYWEVTKARISNVDNPAGESNLAKGTLKVAEKRPLRQPNHRSYRPPKSAMKKRMSITQTELLRPPSITITEVVVPQGLGTHQPISNLCVDLNQADGSCCGYLQMDEEDCRYFVYTVSSQCRNSITSISLDRILRGDVSPRPTRRQRYTISLVLASSFLQLLETPWLTSSFRKEDITFFSDPTNPNVFLLDQPHIARVLATTSPKDGVALSLAQSLDQFGILLLELCFGKILADQPLRKEWPSGQTEQEQTMFDVLAARDWQCEVIEEAGSDYSDAIAWCLGGNRSAPRETWRQDMLRNVVSPLQRCQEYLIRGGRA
ncbi:hypothetical protein V8C42DRAFT_352819 [Trichoderma barbatum]